MNSSIKEANSHDFENIIDYFYNCSEDFLVRMGIDKTKLPEREAWIKIFKSNQSRKLNEKDFFYIIWCLNDKSIGHTNLSDIKYGTSAKIHLHIWNKELRGLNLGERFLKLTIPLFFENFNLVKLICEPSAHNEQPNRVLKKVGFNFIKTHETIPGWINYYQKVNRYELKKSQRLSSI